ncbi:AcrB/AcrD/AcrF family protein [Sphingomonas sp.]|uniref:AcrB/AcrD/AcrF family protein n=1 Tax=Sphingomonas sp. TaxID=28214 RepID=UPI0025D716E2|nr:AcrB/AcrD/AcrF family protein [Sphingomonas sp.]
MRDTIDAGLPDDPGRPRPFDRWGFDHWVRWQTLIWVAAAVFLVVNRWAAITWYSLPDTDDNMRMAQVHALLNGQGWYDLRQYKLNPPAGFDIHWSRLVDLPLAAIELVVRPFAGQGLAERTAAAIAPMLPLWVAMVAMGLAVRRLVAPGSFAIGALLILCCQTAMLMFSPLRVDHHGWQLALLVLTIAGLADRDTLRGGLTMGLSSAASLTIGLELMPFLVIAGGAIVLRWVWDRAEATRLRGYALALGGGCALGYAGFTSYASSVARCDVLSPVWLSTMVAAGVLAFTLSYLTVTDARIRLASVAIGGIALAALFALTWPQCLGRPEQISPELATKWFDNIREAKPLYTQPWTVFAAVVALPVVGVLGSIWAAWQARAHGRFGAWAPVALVAMVSLLLVLWQTRQGPAAQLMAVPGATALAWHFVPRLRNRASLLVRTIGIIAVLGLGASLAMPNLLAELPSKPVSPRSKAIGRANARCTTLPAMAPFTKMPVTTIFTFVDLGPRLINVTPQRAVAGPYHRNGEAILDVHHAFDGAPEAAQAIMRKHGATLLLTCPNMSESTIYRARSPNGFYSRLAQGERFVWLEPMPLPNGSPLMLWRIR